MNKIIKNLIIEYEIVLVPEKELSSTFYPFGNEKKSVILDCCLIKI